ncbi:unnamed protein product [Notodromas monacha]|uniref:Uncharacterized protein n=1 Tax=Notodromas monacha TaxID=399045 RepID=A0A7R9BWZ1_9CRUS|nr:unnamed protein product [Notodromas monacha]CAG0922136.1 unnamed protein product [Notodromas monacha]
MLPSNKALLWSILGLFLVSMLVLMTFKDLPHHQQPSPIHVKPPQGCQPVSLDPSHPSVANLSQLKPDLGICSKITTHVRVANGSVEVTMGNPHSACHFSGFHEEIYWAGDYAIINSGKTWTRAKFTPRLSDFVQAQCVDFNTGFMVDTVLPIARKLPERLLKFRGWQWLPESALQTNVFILVLQRTSSNRFIRYFPKTHKVCQQLKGTYFKGYNAIGHTAMENFLPVFTGQRAAHPVVSQPLMKLYTDDLYPLLFRKFERFGYVTALLDDLPGDSPHRGHERGFRKHPADHYSRPLQLARKFLHHNQPQNMVCINNSTAQSVVLEYTRDLWRIYQDKPKFFVVVLQGNSDDGLAEFLKTNFMGNSWDDTVLAVMSDIGYRQEETRVLQERLEANNPLLYIRFPEAVRKTPGVAHNLAASSSALTTPLDIHATIDSLLHFKDLDFRTHQPFPTGGRNLMQDFNFKSWDCPSLGIPQELCSCSPHYPIDPDSVTDLAKSAVQAINSLVHQEMKAFEKFQVQTKTLYYLDMCVPWRVSGVLWATKSQHYSALMVQVHPGAHRFEVIRNTTPNSSWYFSRNHVDTTACCIPRELYLLRQFCLCDLTIPSVRKACEAMNSA